MGSAASVADAKKEEVEPVPCRAPGDDAEFKDDKSIAPHNVEEEETSRQEPTSHAIEISSSDESITEMQDEAVEEIETMFKKTMAEASTETEGPLAFESFLHKNGTLYSCFSQHGSRVYVDETNGLVPFPDEWYSEGRFINATNEQALSQNAAPSSSQPAPAEPAFAEDDRASAVYIQGKGMLMTYMFEEKANVCRYFDAQSGLWLLLPLQWEMNIDFVRIRIQQVMGALPGLDDPTEVTAALRQCSYDPDEVISAYLSIFGDALLQPAQGEQGGRALHSFRTHLEKERVIEDLRQRLLLKEQEVERLVQRNSQLSRARHPDARPQRRRQAAALGGGPVAAGRAPPGRPAGGGGAAAGPGPGGGVQGGAGAPRAVQEGGPGEEGALQQAAGAAGEHPRLLPLPGRRAAAASPCLEVTSEEEVAVSQKSGKRKFLFDKVYSSSASQEAVFEGTLPVIASCADGYNVCILAYGQTGSGKTYTMMGRRDEPGVNVRSVRELLRICKEREKVTYALKISMLEVYNDSLNDLLAKSATGHLEIRTQGKSVSVPGLTAVEVKTEEDILSVMELGEKNRKIASTKMNIESSRSHLILTLRVDGTDTVSGATSRGTLTLCDLAGSERISKTEAKGARLLEAASINKSLTALGQVFSALKSNALHVPFRNSKLTHLLQPCLSGDAKACVFVNVSPEPKDLPETLSTLQFGSSVRQVALGRAAQHAMPTATGHGAKAER
ncbi:hypothetical protein ANANG_G00313890 [Anguilla anguilla]|uniref:Kinesin-like protein n=1 Tax=Anguilla anguilla TaxID=7936 RepID=A0A9D3LLZ8_ANGAN|nr:hypothetical protein ANANG_G00313890 [Anguilla anguilla]